MESVERPRARVIDVAARGPGSVRRHAARAGRLLRHASSRAWLAAAVTLVGLGLTAQPVLGPLPGFQVIEAGAGPTVSQVGVGSYAWTAGIRPGLVGAWGTVDGDPHHSFSFVTGEATKAMPVRGASADWYGFAFGVACALAALTLGVARLPGAAALLALGLGVALIPVGLQAGLPAALPVIVLPTLPVALLTQFSRPRAQLLFDLASVALVGLLVAGGILLAGGTFVVNWIEAWWAPAWIGAGFAALAGLILITSRYRALPAGTPGRLIAAAVPLAAQSRLAGADDERSQLAIELHNVVLPRVQTSLDSLRGEKSVEDAATELETLAADLRRQMEERQTVTLELGGVAAALRDEFEARPGPRVEFFVSGGSHRPPKRVELAAYRVGQAAIDNALRHSGADGVAVSISSAADTFELLITDDGVGIDDTATEDGRRRGRIGLAQMRLRAESVGATLDLGRGRDGGTEVRFRWAA